MRIGFDAKRAFTNASGLGNYSRTLIQSMLTYYPDNEYFAFTPAMNALLEFEPAHLKIIRPLSLLARSFPSLWRSALVSKDIEKEGISVFHGLTNELPRGISSSTGKIVTIHDLIFLRYPQWYPAADRKIYEKKFSHACREADAVVAVSEQTRKDVIDFFGTPEDRIKVVYQSCGEQFYSGVDQKTLIAFRQKRSLPDRFILYVGTIEERKNLLAVVKALKQLDGVTLVVIGKKKKYFEKVWQFICSNGLKERVLFPEDITHEELPMVYRLALALVYPSYYEGFGIPVIEALWSGTPVITSNSSALPEAGGPSSLYIHPDDEEAMAGKINLILEDPALRERMIREGLEYAQRFHPKKASSDLFNLYTLFSKR